MAEKIQQHRISIAPLDRLLVPSELDGRAGEFRRVEESQLHVDTDLEAVRLWLEQYVDRPQTYQSYRQAVERLFNWALVERNKALSSLDDRDLLMFEEFLADPQPHDRWISLKGISRDNPRWTPFITPLSPGSRLHNLRVLRIMCDWLTNNQYWTVGHSLHRHSTGDQRPPSALIHSVGHDIRPKCIRLEDWHLLRRALQLDLTSERQRETYAAVELMYYCGLSTEEVGKIHCDQISRRGGIMALCVPSRKPGLKTIYLLPPVIQAIDALFIRKKEQQSEPPERSLCRRSAKRNEPNTGNNLISHRTISVLVADAFRHAAQLATSENNMAAAYRFMKYTPHALRHAIEIHACIAYDRDWLWLLIGAKHLTSESTRQYMKRRELTDTEFKLACNALSRYWQDSPVISLVH